VDQGNPEGSQYLSVLTLAEIEKGILLLDEGKRRQEIKQWFENDLPAKFAGRILSIDKQVASAWAQDDLDVRFSHRLPDVQLTMYRLKPSKMLHR